MSQSYQSGVRCNEGTLLLLPPLGPPLLFLRKDLFLQSYFLHNSSPPPHGDSLHAPPLSFTLPFLSFLPPLTIRSLLPSFSFLHLPPFPPSSLNHHSLITSLQFCFPSHPPFLPPSLLPPSCSISCNLVSSLPLLIIHITRGQKGHY